MGILRTTVILLSKDEQLRESVELVVDTGSALTWMDAGTLRTLGYRPRGTRRFKPIRGKEFRKPVCDAVVECEGIRASVGVVFADEGDAHVLGVTALERMGLEVDTVKPALRKSRAFLALRAP